MNHMGWAGVLGRVGAGYRSRSRPNTVVLASLLGTPPVTSPAAAVGTLVPRQLGWDLLATGNAAVSSDPSETAVLLSVRSRS